VSSSGSDSNLGTFDLICDMGDRVRAVETAGREIALHGQLGTDVFRPATGTVRLPVQYNDRIPKVQGRVIICRDHDEGLGGCVEVPFPHGTIIVGGDLLPMEREDCRSSAPF
jgi:hypothetical protein